ncbi:MAG: response regulator [Gemmatimonadota bacterium]
MNASARPARTVLVVEDNPDHALLIRMAAERAFEGLDLQIVSSGEDAIRYLSGEGSFGDRSAFPLPDLVILDLLLPGLGGFQVMEWTAGQPELREIPVVVLTSSVNPGDRGLALSLGARAFHSKPSDVRELDEVVRGILERWLP